MSHSITILDCAELAAIDAAGIITKTALWQHEIKGESEQRSLQLMSVNSARRADQSAQAMFELQARNQHR